MGILDTPGYSRAAIDKTTRRRKRLLDYYNQSDQDSVIAHETVMATPPTVTVGTVAGAASTLTNSRFYSAYSPSVPNPPFRVYGGRSGLQGSGITNSNQTIVEGGGPVYVDFRTDAPSFEVRYYGNSIGYYRVRVDGKLVSTSAITTAGSASNNYLDLYSFGTRQMRHIELETANFFRFGGINVTTADFLGASSKQIGPRVVWVGDSYTKGQGGASYLTAMAPLTCRTLGWKDTYNGGISGTGYLTPGTTPGATKLRDRLAHDVYAYSPEIVVVAMGYNDTYFSMTPSAVQAEALLCYQDIKANLPNATLIVVGHMSMQPPTAAQLAMDAAITAAVTSAGSLVDLYIRPFGDGTAANPAWVDNVAQIASYRNADGIHPSQDGHFLLAQRISDGIRAAAPLG